MCLLLAGVLKSFLLSGLLFEFFRRTLGALFLCVSSIDLDLALFIELHYTLYAYGSLGEDSRTSEPQRKGEMLQVTEMQGHAPANLFPDT